MKNCRCSCSFITWRIVCLWSKFYWCSIKESQDEEDQRQDDINKTLVYAVCEVMVSGWYVVSPTQMFLDPWTHTHPFNGPFSGTTQVSWYQKTIWIVLKQEAVSGSCISWAICKSASRSWQITTQAPHHFFTGRMPFLPPNQQAPHHFFTGRMPFLPPNQQCHSTEGTSLTRGRWWWYW